MRIPTGLNGLASPFGSRSPQAGERLDTLPPFGNNPGALSGKFYVPADLAADAPLVVVLHGCTQDASGYDRGSGWSLLAERAGFAVLFPEQTRANNANVCFNWFQPGDIGRGAGEAMSISQMIEAMAVRHRLDRSRIFVTGLSAGGAMVAAMLAAYPEIFAGGAIIAGIPYGCAGSMPEAFARMRGQGMPQSADLVAAVRAASGHKGPWPTLSVWQGSADQTVAPANAEALIAQWRGVHGLPDAGAARLERIGPHARKVWTDRGGRDVIESYTVAGMGHGAPLDVRSGYGAAGPYMLDFGLSSTIEIARFWGIASESAEPRDTVMATPNPAHPSPATAVSGKVESVIHDALRKAGLMR